MGQLAGQHEWSKVLSRGYNLEYTCNIKHRGVYNDKNQLIIIIIIIIIIE